MAFVIKLWPPGQQPGVGQAFLVTPTGRDVASLKADIEPQSGIPARDQELLYEGRVLADRTALSELAPLSTIHVSTQAGGAFSPAPTGARAIAPSQREECAICLEGYAQPFPVVRLRCRHGFHEPCLMEWARSSPLCPLCRQLMELASPPAYVAPVAGGQGMPYAPGQAQGMGAPAGFAAAGLTGAGLAVALRQNPAVTADSEAISRMLKATRDTLNSSSDWRRLRQVVHDAQSTEAARMMGKGAQLVAGAALGVALGAGRLAANTLIANSSTMAGLAVSAGYRPVAPGQAGAHPMLPSSSSTRSGLNAGLNAVTAVAGAAATAAAMAVAASSANSQQHNQHNPFGADPSTSCNNVPTGKGRGTGPTLELGAGAQSQAGGWNQSQQGGAAAWPQQQPARPGLQAQPQLQPRPTQPSGPPLLRCPNCTLLMQPPAAATAFRCPCGTLLHR